MVKVVKGLSAGWGVCSRIALLSSFTRTLSHHNDSIAVGGLSGDIIILNSITGSQSAVLSGHTQQVKCVVFSSDGNSLVSGSHDRSVKLWDVQTGGVVKTFLGHRDWVWSVSISADLTTIASGSGDGKICLWGIETGECYHTIWQHNTVCHVMFSPKVPQCLISVSGDKLWQWDANGSQIRQLFNGSHVAFSSDGAQFVSCYRKTITVCNSSSVGAAVGFQVAEKAGYCSFSPDNRLVAVAANKTAYCWDITASKPQLVETFIGHTESITSLIFSSPTTLISASEDGSVKFWKIGVQSPDAPVFAPKPTSCPPVPIMYVTLQSKEGIAITLDSEGIIKSWDLSTGSCRAIFQAPTKSFCKRDAQLVNGRMLFVWQAKWKIHMWDAENGELLWEVGGSFSYLDDLRISGDGSRVFGLSAPFIYVLSLQTGEVIGEMDIEYDSSGGSLIVDGPRVWAHWPESNHRGYDFGIQGSTPVKLHKKHKPPSSKLWDLRQARIMNPSTGEVVFQLSGGFTNPACAQCDDSYLVTGYESGEVLILELMNVK